MFIEHLLYMVLDTAVNKTSKVLFFEHYNIVERDDKHSINYIVFWKVISGKGKK